MAAVLNFTIVPVARERPHAYWGTISSDGAPAVMATVVLTQRSTMTVLAATVTDESGTFRFSGLPEQPDNSLILTAFPQDPELNAIIRDRISLALPD